VRGLKGGGFYFYANEKAMEGLKTGKFVDGSILMDEVLELHGGEGGGAKEVRGGKSA
jgi:hypothetical protein